MAKPLVSILIPVYNREKLIGACIQSALEQTITDIEVVVVDNASTDDTWRVCQEYVQKDSRVRIFRNEQNIGPVRNWQRCIDEARGQYGKIIFSDDLIHPQYLEKTIPIIEKYSVAFVFSTVCIAEEEWKGYSFYRYRQNTSIIPTKEYIKDCVLGDSLPVSPGCALFWMHDLRKNLYFKISSPTITDFDKHGAGPDLLLFLLTANNYKNIGYVNDTLVYFRSHLGSITISDKTGYLQKCYLQAKIWFVKDSIHNKLLDKLLINGWLFECKKNINIIAYGEFTRQYLTETKKFNSWILLKVVINVFKIKSRKAINRLIFNNKI